MPVSRNDEGTTRKRYVLLKWGAASLLTETHLWKNLTLSKNTFLSPRVTRKGRRQSKTVHSTELESGGRWPELVTILASRLTSAVGG